MAHRLQCVRGMQSAHELMCDAPRGDSPEVSDASFSSDEALVAALIDGDDNAWRELHARYGTLMRQCIARVMPRGASSEDIQEVFAMLSMQLIANDKHRLRMFDPTRGLRLRSWIALLATHCARDYVRSSRRDREREPLSSAEDLPCDFPSPLDLAERRERAAILASALGTLTVRDRELVSLYLGEELAPEQIAQRMQISVKTVYSKAYKIKARLSAMLSEAKLAA